MVMRACCPARLLALGCKSHMPYKSERIWSPVGSPRTGSSLRVFQWNVLADGLAQHGDFIRVRGADTLLIWPLTDQPSDPGPDVLTHFQAPQQALTWSFRQQLLLEEILKPQADIVCLQEVNKYGMFSWYCTATFISRGHLLNSVSCRGIFPT